jgi:methionyl aminopeptidase
MTRNKNGILLKTKEELKKMAQGGKKLGKIKRRLKEAIDVGVSAQEVEKLAEELIARERGIPSFKLVDKYNWATCINVNEGVVHGIPRKDVVFKEGDIVSVDLGMYYKGFHTDTSFSVGLCVSKNMDRFLQTGKKALKSAISKAKAGNRVYDISKAIEDVLKSANASPIKALVGHGIGRKLHEEPQIPCFTKGKREDSPKIPEGATLAIEVMYAKGSGDVKVNSDGWTVITCDGTISALFEETVAASKDGPIILTK